MNANAWRVLYRVALLTLMCYMTANVDAVYWILLPLALLNPVRTRKHPKPETRQYPRHD